MDAQRHAFSLETYRQVRTEVGVLLVRIESLFRYSLIVVATVFAWLVVQSFGLTDLDETCLKLPKVVLYPAWAIPPAFVLLSSLLILVTHIRVMQMGTFLAECEALLGFASLSWESFSRPKWPIFSASTILSLVLLLLELAFKPAGLFGKSAIKKV